MDMTALFLSRIQFASTITFHIIFPTFTIGLAAWLTVLEALHLSTGRAAYRALFDFCSSYSAWRSALEPCHGAPAPGPPVRCSTSAQDIRHGVRPWCRVRHRDGISVRHELERPVQDVGTNSRATAFVRDIHGLHAGGDVLRGPHFWPISRCPVVLSFFNRNGRVGNDVLRILDHGQ